MRVLVTGHTGYIGSVLVPRLAAAGHEPVGLDCGLFDACIHGTPPIPVPARRRDLRDVTPEDLHGVDAVVHLAALSNDPMGDLAPQLTHEINHDASVRLATMARAAGVDRFVYASSCSVYGASDTSDLVDETAPFAPISAYAISKAAVEDDLHALADDMFSPVYLRNATVYGWSPRPRLDLVLNDLVAAAYTTGRARVLSDGTPWRPIVHVDDVATAFLLALEAPRDVVHDRAFNVGNESQNYQVRDIADIAARVVPGARTVVTGQSGPDTRSYRVSFSRISDELGFHAAWDAERGAAHLAMALERQGLTWHQQQTLYRRLPWILEQQASGHVDASLRPVDLPSTGETPEDARHLEPIASADHHAVPA